MKLHEIRELIFEGDKVLDHMDGMVREISRFEVHLEGGVSVHMTDGGVVGLEEITWNDESPSVSEFKTRSRL